MKKLLALVLALVMTLSLAVVGSNAAFKDADKVNASYAEAVDVLSGMKVFQGYPDGSFQPEGSITRAEVAAIVYRLYTADVADKQASLYATYNKFNDMDGAKWAAGYIGYCANAGLIKGYDAKTFGPSDKVTGYQALAMILRAVGYDKNDEFTGAQWQLRVASTAQQLGILKNVKGVDLNAAASRELVAELLFRTAAEVPMVTYTPALGYTNLTAILNGKANATLGYKNFGLTKVKDTDDKWGRPAYSWTNGKTGSAKVTYATITEKPIATYTTAVTECDVAKDAGQTADKNYKLVVNGANESTITVQRLDTVTKLGAQGRLTEVYEDRIVMIDTFLAKVTENVEAKFDKNSHMTTPYMLKLDVYDNGNTASTVVLTDEDAAFTYAVGDFILLNAYTAKTGTSSTEGGLVAKSSVYNVAANVANYAEIVGKADSLEGAQTVIWYNAAKHTVNGTVYDDAAEFNHNDATTNIGNYTWYFDSYGNLIGSFEIATAYNYGVITKMWFAGDASTGTGKTMAEVTYMDKTTNIVTVSSVDILTADAANGNKTHAYTPVYGYGIGTGAYGDAMQFNNTTWTLPVATNADVNASMDNLTGSGVKSADIINGHLFRMQTLADGSVAFVLVNNGAATSPVHTTVTSTITNKYAWIGNVKVDTETLFLVGTENATTHVYSFETYKGLNEIPSFTKSSVVVDYVLDATTGVAKYVYVVGTPDSAQASDYVLITNDSYTANLKTAANGVQYWEVNLNTLEGLVTVKTQTAAVKDVLTNAANVNKLYYLTYTDGYVAAVSDMKEITTNHQVCDAKKPTIAAVKASGTTKYLNGVLETTINGTQDIRFNVTASTIVVGALSADMTGKIVYVTFDMSNHNAEKVWVVDATATVPGAYPYYVKSATVAKINAPAQYTAVSAATASILTWSSSDGNAAADTLKVSVQWQKWNGTGYENYTEPYFLEGAYRAIVTLSTDNTNNTYPYVINEKTAITYDGAAKLNGFAVEVGYIHK